MHGGGLHNYQQGKTSALRPPQLLERPAQVVYITAYGVCGLGIRAFALAVFPALLASPVRFSLTLPDHQPNTEPKKRNRETSGKMAGRVNRVTMFKMPDPASQKKLLEAFDVMLKAHSKVW